MLYYLFEYLGNHQDIAGAGLYKYISFRAALAFVFALLISTVYGKKIIEYLRRKQVSETVRELGLEGQVQKSGTPTMGGIIIIMATIIPVFLFAKLANIYIIILLITTVWMGAIGFVDDYLKILKKDKEGLKGRFKILGQVGLGVIVGSMLYFSENVTIKEELSPQDVIQISESKTPVFGYAHKSTKTTMPFLKNNEFDYSKALVWLGDGYEKYAWIIFIPFVILVTLGIFAWVSGNIVFSDYLDVMYIPNSGEMVIYISGFAGALIGFLWYNTYPAQVFMGDTGSLTIGGVIAVLAIAVRKELLIPVLAGIFVAENLSVILQVGYFKYTKKKLGQGRRIFKMAPLHHHYQKSGYHESKIVTRFWIIGSMLAVITIVTLKIR